MDRSEVFLYQSHHKDPINKLIHFICIPVIMYSILVTTSKYYYKVCIDIEIINFSFIWDLMRLLFYFMSIYYLRYGFKVGAIMFLYNLVFYIISKAVYSYFKHSSATTFNLFLFAFIIQFIGAFYRRKQASNVYWIKTNLITSTII